jgi:hypothetical protein
MLFFGDPAATMFPQRAGDHLALCQLVATCEALGGAREKNVTLGSPIAAQTITLRVNFKRRTIYQFTSRIAND